MEFGVGVYRQIIDGGRARGGPIVRGKIRSVVRTDHGLHGRAAEAGVWKWPLLFFFLSFFQGRLPLSLFTVYIHTISFVHASQSASPFFLFCMFPVSIQTRPRAWVSCSGRELNALRCWEPPAFLSPPAALGFALASPCEAKYSSARGSRFLAEMASCASMSRPGTPEHWEAAPELVSNGPMGWCVCFLSAHLHREPMSWRVLIPSHTT